MSGKNSFLQPRQQILTKRSSGICCISGGGGLLPCPDFVGIATRRERAVHTQRAHYRNISIGLKCDCTIYLAHMFSRSHAKEAAICVDRRNWKRQAKSDMWEYGSHMLFLNRQPRHVSQLIRESFNRRSLANDSCLPSSTYTSYAPKSCQ